MQVILSQLDIWWALGRNSRQKSRALSIEPMTDANGMDAITQEAMMAKKTWELKGPVLKYASHVLDKKNNMMANDSLRGAVTGFLR